MSDIFKKRIAYKPFEYPGVMDFINPMNQTFWVHAEVDFTGDVQDYKAAFSPEEQSAIKYTLLAIAQVEVAVKAFWGNLYNRLPKPEFNGLGSTFAECEFRHSEAYSRLLSVLGLEEAFAEAIDSPILKKRLNVLNNKEKLKKFDDEGQAFALELVLFSLLVENVSLFSQFAIILSFTHFKGLLKNTSNIIAWTSKDEQVHANAGIYLFNQVIKENPHFFTEEFKAEIYKTVHESIAMEGEILDWIFQAGELEHISREQLINFMKVRINRSLEKIDLDPILDVDEDRYKEIRWFEEEVFANTLDDFFAKRPVDYSKHNKAYTADDLF